MSSFSVIYDPTKVSSIDFNFCSGNMRYSGPIKHETISYVEYMKIIHKLPKPEDVNCLVARVFFNLDDINKPFVAPNLIDNVYSSNSHSTYTERVPYYDNALIVPTVYVGGDTVRFSGLHNGDINTPPPINASSMIEDLVILSGGLDPFSYCDPSNLRYISFSTLSSGLETHFYHLSSTYGRDVFSKLICVYISVTADLVLLLKYFDITELKFLYVRAGTGYTLDSCLNMGSIPDTCKMPIVRNVTGRESIYDSFEYRESYLGYIEDRDAQFGAIDSRDYPLGEPFQAVMDLKGKHVRITVTTSGKKI